MRKRSAEKKYSGKYVSLGLILVLKVGEEP